MNGQINSSPKDCILFDKMLCCVSKWLAEVFCYICQQFDPCIPTPCFTAGNSDHEAVSSNACLKWSQRIRIVQTRIEMKAHKQAHSDLSTDNAGPTESNRTCSRLRNTFGALIWPHGSCFCFCDL